MELLERQLDRRDLVVQEYLVTGRTLTDIFKEMAKDLHKSGIPASMISATISDRFPQHTRIIQLALPLKFKRSYSRNV